MEHAKGFDSASEHGQGARPCLTWQAFRPRPTLLSSSTAGPELGNFFLGRGTSRPLPLSAQDTFRTSAPSPLGLSIPCPGQAVSGDGNSTHSRSPSLLCFSQNPATDQVWGSLPAQKHVGGDDGTMLPSSGRERSSSWARDAASLPALPPGICASTGSNCPATCTGEQMEVLVSICAFSHVRAQAPRSTWHQAPLCLPEGLLASLGVACPVPASEEQNETEHLIAQVLAALYLLCRGRHAQDCSLGQPERVFIGPLLCQYKQSWPVSCTLPGKAH